jgi:hypothetical protein
MRPFAKLTIAAAIMFGAFQLSAAAQSSDMPAPQPNPVDAPAAQTSQSSDSERAPSKHRLTREQEAALAKTKAADKAQAAEKAPELIKTLNLSCAVTDSNVVARGPATVNGKNVNSTTYEVACGNGMGYLIVSPDTDAPISFSCFAAEDLRATDAVTGKADNVACALPANADQKAMAASVMDHAGTPCAVREQSWMGQDKAAQEEYVELVCDGGKGYILAIPLAGAPTAIGATSCADVLIKKGMSCRLPANVTATNVVSADTFKDALTKNGVACHASKLHAIGQEKVKQRYVVEFLCPEQPKGLIAFIPLAGNPNKFESFDCAGAAKFKLTCKYPPKE